MGKLAAFIMELFRMSLILVLTLYLLGGLEHWLFEQIYGWEGYLWSASVGNLILFFVLYRNRWQFKGWYKSDNNQKLRPALTKSLSVLSIVLILLALAAPGLT